MEVPGHLQEFILALNEEIEAAQKNLATSAVLLSEGQFVAPVGASFRKHLCVYQRIQMATLSFRTGRRRSG